MLPLVYSTLNIADVPEVAASPSRTMDDVIAEYGDQDLTFFLNTYHDHEWTDRCLAALRRHYPQVRVIVRADGDPDPRNAQLAGRYKVDFRPERRLFTVENGGAIIERMFEIFLERPTPFLFKIDPDTAIHRRFRYLPKRSGHFGTVMGLPSRPAIQGGGMGFTIDCVRRLVESELLRCPELKKPQSAPTRSAHWKVFARRAQRCGLSSFDWVLGWAATELKIPLFHFPEVHCTWKDRVDNSDLRFAITHPA